MCMMCIVRQSQNLESGQSCFFGLLTQAPVQKKTLKSFSLYKRSIELVWGKGTLRKARATFKSYQALCLIVPHCAIKTLPYSIILPNGTDNQLDFF